MSKGIFITATGTDVGKTYICGLVLKKLIESGESAIYYKAALSGAEEKEKELIAGDAEHVFKTAGLDLNPNDYVSYIYKEAYSPHLASQLSGELVETEKIEADYRALQRKYKYIIAEGSGGIICPLRMDDEQKIMLTDVIKRLRLDTLIVAPAGLGSINSTLLTINYAKAENIGIKGIILNNYDRKNPIHLDNKTQLEQLSGINVIGTVEAEAEDLDIDIEVLKSLFSADIIQKDMEYIWHPCSQMKDYEEMPPILIERGKGLYLYDENEKAYADTVSSWWCNLLGHSNERINNAVKKQLDKLEHVIFANFTHRPAVELCEKLSKVLPKGLSKFFFTDNGSSAIEAAMKMSFQYHYQSGNPQKTKFMAMTDAYHGETLGALSTGGVDIYSTMYKPLLLDVNRIESPDCYRCSYGQDRKSCDAPCFEHAEKTFEIYGDTTAAMLVEPLFQGAAGMKIYPPIYLKKLRARCDRYNVHLIADEIATGYGRTGKMFAFDHAEIAPDIICLSKGLTGGYMPMALAVTTNEIYNAFYGDYNEGKAFMHSHTYSGNPLACSAAIEVLNILEEENIIEKASAKAEVFTKLIKEALGEHPNVGEIRSIGLINAIELVEDKATKKSFDSKLRMGYQIYKRALEKGLILRPLGNVLYFNPPLIIEESDMKHVVKLCKEAVIEILGE